MRATLSRRLSALLMLSGALACADQPTVPTAAPAERPAARLAGRVGPDVRRATLRALYVSDLGALRAPLNVRSEAWRINERGQVIGMSGDSASGWSYERPSHSYGHGFMLDPAGMTDLTALAGTRVFPTGLSNDGTMVFDSYGSTFRWDATPARLDGVPAGCTSVGSMDVNDAVLVAGLVYCASNEQSAAVWRPGVGWQRLPGRGWWPASGDRFETGAFAVNRAGDVAGASPGTLGGATILPTLWTAPGYASLVLDCRPACVEGWARDLNDRRWVVGATYDRVLGAYRAFAWTPTGGFERIEPLPGDTQSEAYAIDGWNRVVGVSWRRWAAPRAFVWTRRDGTQPLPNLPAATGSKAFSINNRGQIVGSSGSYRFRVPEESYDADRTRAALWQLESWLLNLLADQTIIRSSLANIRIVVLGAPGINPMLIEPSTLRLGDEVGQDTPPAVDAKGNPVAYAKDANGDGLTDLVVEFPIPALVKNGDVTKETTELLLTGALGQGTSVHGALKVTVVP
jgi:uncharacterized membrane protein